MIKDMNYVYDFSISQIVRLKVEPSILMAVVAHIVTNNNVTYQCKYVIGDSLEIGEFHSSELVEQ